MLDLKTFDEALKIRWVGKLLESEASWKTNIDKIYPMLSEFSIFGDEFGKKILNNVKNPFWKDTFKYYYTYFKKYTCKTLNELDATSFLFNSNIFCCKE